ncbi:ribonuclease H-like domain-containing protein [Tanacetum coccineum]
MSVHGYTDDEFVSDHPVTLISRLDVSNLLHLHPNDSAALTIVSVKLKGTKNHQVWFCAMLLALERKNKIGFIDGSYRRSNTDEVLGKQWDRVNAMLPRCTCHASDDFKKRNQLMKLMQFLMGLDDTYMQIRSSILSRETFLDARSVYATISSGESHRVASGSIQLSTLTSLIKDNSLNGKNVQANMAGANQHMTHIDKELVNVYDISYLRIKVGHPNGTEAFKPLFCENGYSLG